MTTATAYREQLQALLPPGAAWPREPGAVLTQVLDALAEELARVDGRGDDLVAESDVRGATELLAEWERVLGLPDACTGAADTAVERRAAAHEKLTRLGGATPAYFIAVAARLGFTVTITEFRRHTVADDVVTPLRGVAWCYAWQVNAPAETVTVHTVQSTVADPLRDWGNAVLECVIGRLKPAHTHVLFAYA